MKEKRKEYIPKITNRTLSFSTITFLILIIACAEKSDSPVNPGQITSLNPGVNEIEMEFDGLQRSLTVQLPIDFQQETSYYRNKALKEPGTVFKEPAPYKYYPDAEKTQLVKPDTENGMPIWRTIKNRRSERDFTDNPVESSELSQLLWACQGMLAGGTRRLVSPNGRLSSIWI